MSNTNSQQLETDLMVYKGNNKARLIARCYMFATNGGTEAGELGSYDQFKKLWLKRSFQRIHDAFDHVLPQQYRG